MLNTIIVQIFFGTDYALALPKHTSAEIIILLRQPKAIMQHDG
jgi:hypothetical protein